MASIRQKRVARKLVENLASTNPATKQEIVESSGYSHLTADRVSKNIIESKGVQEELVLLGFNETRAKQVVSEILERGEDDGVKLKAADMIFKVHGTYAAERHVNLNVHKRLDDAETEKLADDILRLQKENN